MEPTPARPIRRSLRIAGMTPMRPPGAYILRATLGDGGYFGDTAPPSVASIVTPSKRRAGGPSEEAYRALLQPARPTGDSQPLLGSFYVSDVDAATLDRSRLPGVPRPPSPVQTVRVQRSRSPSKYARNASPNKGNTHAAHGAPARLPVPATRVVPRQQTATVGTVRARRLFRQAGEDPVVQPVLTSLRLAAVRVCALYWPWISGIVLAMGTLLLVAFFATLDWRAYWEAAERVVPSTSPSVPNAHHASTAPHVPSSAADLSAINENFRTLHDQSAQVLSAFEAPSVRVARVEEDTAGTDAVRALALQVEALADTLDERIERAVRRAAPPDTASMREIVREELSLRHTPVTGSEDVRAQIEAMHEEMAQMRAHAAGPEPLPEPNVPAVDYALLTMGGRPVLAETSASLGMPRYAPSWLFGSWAARMTAKPPEVTLTADTTLGNCWAFAGASGTLTVALGAALTPTHVTIDHVAAAPGLDRASAPRRFRVLAVLPSGADVCIGEHEYDLALPAAQTFALRPGAIPPVRKVRLEILSNHGRAEYTCLYRFRVHGAA